MMNTPLRRLKKSDIQWAVDRNKERIQNYARLALSFLTDPEKKERRQGQYCVCCYYTGMGMAGAAMTESQCGVCEKELHWSSTYQEKLCPDCAKTLGLCKECGATMELKEPRSFKSETIELPKP